MFTADDVHGPSLRAHLAELATSEAAGLVPPRVPKVTMAEAREAALRLGEGRRFEVAREREDADKAARILMANRGQRVDTATSKDPAERQAFSENYKAALLDISKSLGGLR